jgi:hypothetical protein
MNSFDQVPTKAGVNTATREPDPVEEALVESFPASDPPAWTGVTGVGPPPPAATVGEPIAFSQPTARQTTLARQTRGEHDALLVAMHRLEAALAAAAPGRESAWNARVLKDLGGVQECLARHVASAEAPDGLLAEIDLSHPTLARRVDRLRHEHADLLQQAGALARRVEEFWCVEWATGTEERPDTADIRQRAARLLAALRDHQAHEADLILETFCTDIGAGD